MRKAALVFLPLLSSSMFSGCLFSSDPKAEPTATGPGDACATCDASPPAQDAPQLEDGLTPPATDSSDGPVGDDAGTTKGDGPVSPRPDGAEDASEEDTGPMSEDGRIPPPDASEDPSSEDSSTTLDATVDLSTDTAIDGPIDASMDGIVESCVPRELRVNSTDHHQDQNPEPSCTLGADGEFVMEYTLEKGPSWVSCVFSKDQRPDLFSNPSDVFEVTYCLSAPTPGQLAVWHELVVNTQSFRFPMQLFSPDEVAIPGCYRKYFRSADVCNDKCRQFMRTATSSQFAFVGEYRRNAPSAGDPPFEARIVSLRRYPGSCVCLQEGDCSDPVPACTAGDGVTDLHLPHPRCGSATSCAGLCRATELDDGNGGVGRYVDSTQPDVTPVLRAAYRRLRPLLGSPGCTAQGASPAAECASCTQVGGTCPSPYIFDLGGVRSQLFYQANKQQRTSADDPGWGALLLNPEVQRAISLRWPFLQLYRCMRVRGAPDAGPEVLGRPMADAWTDVTTVRQEFENGDLAWSGSELAINTTFDTNDLNLTECAGALAPLTPRIKPRGGSDIIVFSFATGTEGMKANPEPKPKDITALASIAWAPNEGDLNPGAVDLTIPFSDDGQSTNFFLPDPGLTSRDLTNMTLFIRVKSTSGFSRDQTLPGGVFLTVYDQSYVSCASGFLNVTQGGIWKEYMLSLKGCGADGGSTIDLKHIIAYGLRFETGWRPNGPPSSPKPTEARIYVDTVGYRALP